MNTFTGYKINDESVFHAFELIRDFGYLYNWRDYIKDSDPYHTSDMMDLCYFEDEVFPHDEYIEALIDELKDYTFIIKSVNEYDEPIILVKQF